jgi:hypothetical protein
VVRLFVCTGIALAYSELPLTVIDAEGLADRVHERGGEREVRFQWYATPTLLPVIRGGRLRVVKWGNRDRVEKKLPPTGWTWKESVESGKWSALAPEPVLIPATYCFSEGVWFRVKQGIEGLLVEDRKGQPVVYVVCQPSTRYYRVMTRSEWMPSLVGEVI